MAAVNQLLEQRLAEISGRLSVDRFLITLAIKVISDLSEEAEVTYIPAVFDHLIGRMYVSIFSEGKRLYAEHALQQGLYVAEATAALQPIEGHRFEDHALLQEFIHPAPADGLIRRYHLEAIHRYQVALSSFLNLHGNQPVSAFVLNHCAEDIKAIKDLCLMTEVEFTENQIATVLQSAYDEI